MIFGCFTMGSMCCKPKVVKSLLENIIESNKIVIFSKSNCVYCTDVKTVPQVFINGKFIGGEIDVFHMRASGELRTLLHKVFHGLAYNKCPIDVLQPCTPTVVGPRAGLPKAWSTPEAFTKYKPISYSMSTPVKQYPIYRKEDHILYPEYR
ncbi:uncharacterized monothiol glutaredoxin F10D7.3-like isoform X2 [Cimex lectularius]|uniref:Glutaredoxin n=1 Tax=Cimex lectularius TaxID=79782 RepID=A0A8I6SAG6_CIMLE|nr:uncharacterized monothiol glutaredoxin F10D7.3-like isoform X2 [Cimex lectularius]